MLKRMPYIGLTVRDFIKEYQQNKWKKWDVLFLLNVSETGQVTLREKEDRYDKVHGLSFKHPIRPDVNAFIENGYESLLDRKIVDSQTPYNGETFSWHITIGNA